MTESEMLNSWEPAIVQILATDRDGSTYFVGTGFAIASFGRSALFVTATHVLEGVQQVHYPRSRSHPSTPEFLIPPSARQLNLDERGVRVLYFAGGGKVDWCRITWTAALDGLDVAFFGIGQQEHFDGGPFPLKFDLDSRPIRVGERVYAVGSRMDIFDEVVTDEGLSRNIQMKVSRTLVSVAGVVSESWIGGREGKPWPGFAADVVTSGGMSGGPVFRLAEGRVGICGVISRGGAFDGFESSTFAAIWPALLTDVHVLFEGWKGPALPTILDLVEAKIVSDVNTFFDSFRIRQIADDSTRLAIEVHDWGSELTL